MGLLFSKLSSMNCNYMYSPYTGIATLFYEHTYHSRLCRQFSVVATINVSAFKVQGIYHTLQYMICRCELFGEPTTMNV